MPIRPHTYKVFVSSTFEDLKEHRAHVIRQLRRAGFYVDPMEDWPADSAEPKHFSQERLEGCDLCVLLVAFRRGYVPDGEFRSITQMEYEAAIKRKMDIMVFILEEDALWKARFDERNKDLKLRNWHAHLRKKHKVENFTHEPRSIDLTGSLVRWSTKKNVRSIHTGGIVVEWPKGKSPYPGLEWFDEEYAPLFFGRDHEVEAVIAKMSDPHGRFLVISGASGCGKSSLVAAGLWQALLKEGRIPDSQRWEWVRITPSADSRGPFASLTAGLKHVFSKLTIQADDLTEAFANDPKAFKNYITSQLTEGQDLILVVDQLEELFTQNYPLGKIQSFLAKLVTISQKDQNQCRVVTTIRSDFFGRLADSEDVLQQINKGFHHLVGPISQMALMEMIQKPAQATGYSFEKNLDDMILDEAGREPGNLPLVAYTLKQLFEHRQDRLFTVAAYKNMGGVLGAIGNKADQVIKLMENKASEAFNRVFGELVHLERDRPPIRRRVPFSEFDKNPEAKQLIQRLAGQDCRILVVGEKGTVEVAHERLFTAWPILHEWIKNSDEGLRLIAHATEEAQRWKERGEMAEELWLFTRANEVMAALHNFGKAACLELDRFLKPQEVLINQLNHKNLSHKQRYNIGVKLAQFGDDRPGVGIGPNGLPDIAWIEIPGGRVTLPDIDHEFEVKPFRLAKYPVTKRQFQAFIDDGGYESLDWWPGISKRSPKPPEGGEANCPQEFVAFSDALAYCRWLSARTGTPIRLPTEWEWQQAATGGDPSYEFPWGINWDPTRCNWRNCRLNCPTPVGIYPDGATQQGLMDMTGNVWEWCLNKTDDHESDESVAISQMETRRRLRGGSYYNKPVNAQSSAQNQKRHTRVKRDNEGIGFRPAQDRE